MPKKISFKKILKFNRIGSFVTEYNNKGNALPQNIGLIRIPIELREALNLDDGNTKWLYVEITVLDEKPKDEFSLSELLSRIKGGK